jgi:hypothetical protein
LRYEQFDIRARLRNELNSYVEVPLYLIPCVSHGSTVGIVVGYGLVGRGIGVWVSVGLRILFYPYCPFRLWGPPNLLSNVGKRQGRVADHSPPNSAEVKKTSIYTSTPPYVFIE